MRVQEVENQKCKQTYTDCPVFSGECFSSDSNAAEFTLYQRENKHKEQKTPQEEEKTLLNID